MLKPLLPSWSGNHKVRFNHFANVSTDTSISQVFMIIQNCSLFVHQLSFFHTEMPWATLSVFGSWRDVSTSDENYFVFGHNISPSRSILWWYYKEPAPHPTSSKWLLQLKAETHEMCCRLMWLTFLPLLKWMLGNYSILKVEIAAMKTSHSWYWVKRKSKFYS